MEGRKCIIKSTDYSGMYMKSVGMYTNNLYDAKILNEEGAQRYLNDSEYEVIFLDSRKGLELLAKEIERVDGRISQAKSELRSLTRGKENLYSGNEKMLTKYVKMHNESNGILGVSENRKQTIIDIIIEEHENSLQHTE